MAEALARVHGRHYLGIFVIACGTLAYQILITRFFSVMLYYHFAFAAISFAMLGLTRGAIAVFRNEARYATARVDIEFARHAAWFAITAVVAMVAFLCIPLVVPDRFTTSILAAAALFFIAPFTQSGICIALLLTRLPFGGGRLYASDLAGAALGCIGIIAVLFIIDPVSATLWVAALSAFAGYVAVRGAGDRGARAFSGTVAAVMLVLAVFHTGLYLSGQSHLGVFWAKGKVQTDTLFERWNTFSRVRVKPLGDSPPFGWGFATRPTTLIDQNYLDIDADAATVITKFDGDAGELAYLRDDIINAAYLVQPAGDVAVVGVGGGRDILSALHFGAKSVKGIEINPAIFEVLTDKFADFSGHLYRQPGVSLVNAEARSYINHSPDRYDLIQISLIDTWAATAAGGLTLTENRLYTVEAWKDFYRALKPGGMLSVSRWFMPPEYTPELYRLLAIAGEALKETGVAPADVSRHVIALNVGRIVTVITRPTAFTDAEWQTARAAFDAQGFKVLVGPGVEYDAVATTIVSGKADDAFFDSLPQDVTPSTDNKPFFFFTSRLGSTIAQAARLSLSNNSAAGMMFLLLALTLVAVVIYVVVPFAGLARKLPMATIASPVVFFSAIGLGFMLIEISQMQRLMVYLGHPVFGLGVVLFTLLLFSGIGSATVPAGTSSRTAMLVRSLALLAAIALTGGLTPFVTSWTTGLQTPERILVSVLLLAPPSFFMGMMFPLGLGLWRRETGLPPFFWSANGIMSVFASVLGMVLSIIFGIAETYAIGCFFYLVCVVTLIRAAGSNPAAA